MDTQMGVIYPDRLRKIPRYFSWLDHDLVRKGFLKKCSSDASSFYLFLICVGDKSGISYYSDNAINKRLNLASLAVAKTELVNANLIAYSKPFYQVLSLPSPKKELPARVITDKSNPNYIPTAEEIKTLVQGFYDDKL